MNRRAFLEGAALLAGAAVLPLPAPPPALLPELLILTAFEGGFDDGRWVAMATRPVLTLERLRHIQGLMDRVTDGGEVSSREFGAERLRFRWWDESKVWPPPTR